MFLHDRRYPAGFTDRMECLRRTLQNTMEKTSYEDRHIPLHAGRTAISGRTVQNLLVSCVAHEINNPNNYILHNAQIVSEIWQDTVPILEEYFREHGDFELGGLQLPFSEIREVMPRLIAGIADGSHRIRNIVGILKQEAQTCGEGYLETSVNINSVVVSALSLLRNEITRLTDDIGLNLQEHLPPVNGNTHRLEQVMMNLVANALEALPSRQAGVVITTRHDAASREVVVSVRDEGIGMDAECLKRITEPFFSTKKSIGGTGLGLYISRSIVQEHRGEMQFISDPGNGTTATVRLPGAYD